MADNKYDPPRIEERAVIENPLIGSGVSSNVCAVFRPS
jgi:hypothetical protein